jgi:trehalose 6-phosphate synthase/phosphatase
VGVSGALTTLKRSRLANGVHSLFQCRQCQDLLENNLARKRPIEVLVGKKNLEVRPIAVNKGEIVKRLLYLNPDVEFIFCAGDDKVAGPSFLSDVFFNHHLL